MSLKVDRDGPLLRITLARPEKRNAFDAALIASLTEAFGDVGDARAVVLTGEGPSFSAGGDIEWMRSSIDLTAEENVVDAQRLHALFEAADTCPAPLVVAAHGHAMGGACGLIGCSDVAIAHPETVFGFGEVKLGLVPSVISPFVMARTGPGGVRRLFVTGERFDAQTALRIGLVDELAGDLEAAVERVTSELLLGAPKAQRIAKLVLRAPISAQESAELIAELRTSPEGQEGLRAFLERRPADWTRGNEP